jgi:hypothetical protein
MDTLSGRGGEGVGPRYIPQLCVTKEYITLYSSVRRPRYYIHRLVCQLTKEYNLRPSV